MTTLYEFHMSGNCYKVRLICAELGLPLDLVEVDISKGASRTPEFLAKNPNGRVPTVKLDDGTYLAESNAILWYFAEGTELLPKDKLARARVLEWMFFEQYSHEPYVAVARAWVKFFGVPKGKEAELDERIKKGYAALDVMERTLVKQPFLAGDAFSIADIALYAYTHVAPDGGMDLSRYEGIRAWMARVAARPKHITIRD